MSNLDFSIDLPASAENLMKLSLDYENISEYLPNQLQSIKIIEKDDKQTTTEEVLIFKTVFKNTIQQKTIHKKISDNSLQTEIISGPAKGTIIDIEFKGTDSGTKVIVEIDLKLNLKTRFLQPVIKKLYKKMLLGILYKMNTKALNG